MKINIFLFPLILIFISFSVHSQGELIHIKLCDLPEVVAESSGLLIVDDATIWTHNDSGYDNELFLVDSSGVLLRTVVVTNATNIDWEDLAYDYSGNIWINDAGNNNNTRTDLKLYKVNAADIEESDFVEAEIIFFDYPDQTQFPPPVNNMNFDIEAMVFSRDSLYLFTKNRSNPTSGYTKMYSLPAVAGTYTANLVDSFFVDSDIIRSRVTAADIHFPTGKVALLTRTQIITFSDYGDESFFTGKVERNFFKNRTDQVEALGFLTENTFYMTDEGSPELSIPGSWYHVKPIISSSFEPFAVDFRTIWNPENSSMYLEGKEHNLYSFRLFSINGIALKNGQFLGSKRLTLNTFLPGIYLISVTDNQSEWTTKFIINE
ncbi:MAG: T9SS C-terminal target domain-containing protein [Saprospirales bacterium]|nr:MAG: T9SS C-terminal target domain-containing protein [Saprospirales bacterium]